MRLSTLFIFGSTLMLTLAQNISETYVIDQSADFNLVVQSCNKTLDGKLLGACHDGAAFEGMCIVDGSFTFDSNYVSFQYNTTRYICTETNSTGTFTIPCSNTPVDPTLQSGTVTWWLPLGGPDPPSRVSEQMYLAFNPSSNVAMTQISFVGEYGNGAEISFDGNGLMNILQYEDDQLEPGSEYLPAPQPLYRWYICWTNWTGYHYLTLTWVMGIHSPQNPTCQKVDVKRVFV